MNVDTTPAQSPALVFYVFRSYGPKNIADLREDSCAAAQLGACDLFQTRLSEWANVGVNIRVCQEYRRQIGGLSKLPRLKSLLEATRRVGGRVYIDDFRRLFVRCASEDRMSFLEQLLEYGETFWDVRHRSSLSGLNDGYRRDVLNASGAVRPIVRRKSTSKLTEDERRDQTAAAASASTAARKDAALQAAMALAKVRADLSQRGAVATLRAITDAANERGLRTSRGTAWSVPTACRALNKLEEGSDPATK